MTEMTIMAMAQAVTTTTTTTVTMTAKLRPQAQRPLAPESGSGVRLRPAPRAPTTQRQTKPLARTKLCVRSPRLRLQMLPQ